MNDTIDTTTAQGPLVFNLFTSPDEFERDMIQERTRAGLAAARARGRFGGRTILVELRSTLLSMAKTKRRLR